MKHTYGQMKKILEHVRMVATLNSLSSFGQEEVVLLTYMLATNAISKRSVFAMCQIKTYLRTTMTQCQLDHVVVLHIHKSLRQYFSRNSLIEFVSENEARKLHFGKFVFD